MSQFSPYLFILAGESMDRLTCETVVITWLLRNDESCYKTVFVSIYHRKKNCKRPTPNVDIAGRIWQLAMPCQPFLYIYHRKLF